MASLFQGRGLGRGMGPRLGLAGYTSPLATGILPAATKRKAFFSFHYDDIMRVNAVRNAFKIYNPQGQGLLALPTFYDSSLWESRKLEGPDALKRLIREGVQYTSVVAVLVGSETWSRRWVRYEIARSVIDGRGLVAIHINSINHHRDRVPHARGYNPLNIMAIGKMGDGTYRLFLHTANGWERYQDYTGPVPLPKYLPEPAVGYVTALAKGTREYDFALQSGWKNVGGWLDLAAMEAGR